MHVENADIPRFADYPPTIANVIADAVKRYGGREFMVDGERRLTFAQAERESAILAKGLLALGIGKGTRVAIALPDGADWVLAWLAAARIGALTLPLSTFFQPKELDWALREADVDTLFVASEVLGKDFLERLERAVPALASQQSPGITIASHPYLRRIVALGDCDRSWAIRGSDRLAAIATAKPAIDDAFLGAVESELSPADLLIGICTSGSTAHPKIVIHTHGSLVRMTHAYRPYTFGMKAEDRSYSGMPFFWVGGLNSNLMPALYSGACMVFSRSTKTEDILDLMVREKVTRVSMWPMQFKPLLDLANSRGIDITHTIPHLQVNGADGKPIPPHRRIASVLGMTESWGPHGGANWGEDLGERNGASWGRNIQCVERRVVDPVTRKDLRFGTEGELVIRGFSLMHGYYKRERADTFDADGWFATGDRCTMNEDGYIWFKGRLGDMIKTSGANVSPQEVEVVMNTCRGVGEAIVLGLPDEKRGERVVAVVVPRLGESVDPEAIRRRMLEEISSYKVPGEIVVMTYDDVPRTTSGKAKRGELKVMLTRSVAPNETTDQNCDSRESR